MAGNAALERLVAWKLERELGDVWHCEHANRQLTLRSASNGADMYREQCLDCGAPVGQFIKREVVVRSGRAIEKWDTQLQERWRAGRATAREEARARWWNLYDEYLSGPVWKAKRALVLRRANGRCEGCAEHGATQVHHLTYDRVGREMLFDLVAICDACHEAIHGGRGILGA